MKKQIGIFAAVLAASFVTMGCTDARMAQFSALGDKARVTCYSGGVTTFDDFSTGKVDRADSGSDGYYFVAQSTNRLVEVSGDCTLDYGASRPGNFQAIIRPASPQP